jgi:branched-chain amino acid transport system ATP-binding protein
LADNSPALEVRNVRAGYGDLEILRDVSLTIQRGHIVTIIGANGAGKSTLLKTLFGLLKPTAGQIVHEGEDITGWSSERILRRGIAFSPGGRANFPAMTVQENLELGAYIRSDSDNIRAEIDALCRRFPLLQEKRHTAIGNLSGGQQQLVEIAMALMLNPRLMLIDEPTIGLAPLMVEEIFRIIQEINAEGTTMVLVEQNAKRALEISDYGFVLELGRIRYQGSAGELSSFEEVYRAYLGER